VPDEREHDFVDGSRPKCFFDHVHGVVADRDGAFYWASRGLREPRKGALEDVLAVRVALATLRGGHFRVGSRIGEDHVELCCTGAGALDDCVQERRREYGAFTDRDDEDVRAGLRIGVDLARFYRAAVREGSLHAIDRLYACPPHEASLHDE
jgi:hypothetical protein